MGSFEEPSLTEGRAELNPMCLSAVIFSAEELAKDPSAANEAAFSLAEKASHAGIVTALEERANAEGGPDRYMDQVRDLYRGEEEVVDDTNLTLEFLGGLQNFVGKFRQEHSLN